MKQQRFTERFETVCKAGLQLAKAVDVDALLVLMLGPTNWERLRELAGDVKLIVAGDSDGHVEGASDAGVDTLVLDMADSPVSDKVAQAVIECFADDLIPSGARVVVLYSGFEPDTIDSISVVHLGDHLGRLTLNDLKQIETRVPLDTLHTVVNLALEIGREGREGKPVGTLFVVGDSRKVLPMTRQTGFDPVRGYNRKERNLKLPRVREGIKEIAQLDGAIIVSPDCAVEGAARYVDASAANITLSKGLGSRHWAAAAISRATKAIAVAVSETNGTVRMFQDGEVILRIEPFRRPMKWKEFEYEPPVGE